MKTNASLFRNGVKQTPEPQARVTLDPKAGGNP